MQETYLAAFEGLDGFQDRGPGSFRSWLESILDHKASDQVKRHVAAQKRSAKREESQAAGDSRSSPVAPGASPSVLVANDERRTMLSINGRKRALEFAWPRVTDEIEAVYRSLIAGPMTAQAKPRSAARSAA